MRNIKRKSLLIVATLLLASAFGVQAQDAYPSKPLKMITPYPPGASTDMLARLVAQSLSKMLGQPVIVESKAGAGGTIAAQTVARADPDGYTFMLTAGGIMTINPTVYKALPYDPVKDFTSLTVAVRVPIVVAVKSNSPLHSNEDLLKAAKAAPGKLTYGSAGIGTSQHLAGELYKNVGKVDLLHVPYKGGAPAMSDLLGGQIDLMFVQIPSAEPQAKAGTIRLLAVGSPTRSKMLPDVPTVAETGLAGYDSDTWYGFNMPAKVPPAISATLHDAIVKALDENEGKLEALGFVKDGGSQADMDRIVREDIEKWGKVIRDAGFAGSQ